MSTNQTLLVLFFSNCKFLRNSELIQVKGTQRVRGRPKITLVELIKNEISIEKVRESMTLDRIEWKEQIYIVLENEGNKRLF